MALTASNLFLDQFLLFGLKKLLGHTLRAVLGTQKKLPKLRAEWRRLLVQEASELNLQGFDVGLRREVSFVENAESTIEFVRTNREPSIRLKHSSITTSSSLPRISEILLAIHLPGFGSACADASTTLRKIVVSDFFMTWRLTFCMSTFRPNSGGNLVDLRSLASTPDAILLRRGGRSSVCRLYFRVGVFAERIGELTYRKIGRLPLGKR